MKKILEICKEEYKSEQPLKEELLKIRLRGKGSGQKEKGTNMENNEYLHLCISCKSDV